MQKNETAILGAILACMYLLTAPLLGLPTAAKAEDPLEDLPAVRDFMSTRLNDDAPVFDSSGTHLIWRGRHNGHTTLLRASVTELGRPVELLGQNEDEYLRNAVMSPNRQWIAALLREESGYRLSIVRPDGTRSDIHIPLEMSAYVFEINNLGEPLIIGVHENGAAVFRLDAQQRLAEILNDPNYKLVAFDEKQQPVFKIMPDVHHGGIASALIKGEWKAIDVWPTADVIINQMFEFQTATNSVDIIMRLEGGTGRIVQISLADGTMRTLAHDPDYDIETFSVNKLTGQLDFYVTADPNPSRPAVHFINPADNARLALLEKKLSARIVNIDRSPTRDIWIVRIESDRTPPEAVIFDWEKQSVTGTLKLRTAKVSDTWKDKLSTTSAVQISARDGTMLDGFLTLPNAVSKDHNGRVLPAPLVLNIHGGPNSQDRWEYTPDVQLLASRGYAVLQVNYRGSLGRGLSFESAARPVLDGKALDDVSDTLHWATKTGLAEPGQIAVMGASFGGYLATALAARHPQDIACGISLSGAYDLLALAQYQQRPTNSALTRIGSTFIYGDVASVKIQDHLRAISPAFYTERIDVPFLIGVGADDDRVLPETALSFARKLEKAGNKAIIAFFEDEGHSLDWVINATAYLSVVENFLASCLGGAALPLPRDVIAESTMQIQSDNGLIPGLKDVMPVERYKATLDDPASMIQ